MDGALHHIELWTHDLEEVLPAWDWLFAALGWFKSEDDWPQGCIWAHADGTYVVLEQSPDVHGRTHDRQAPGLNHLALLTDTRERLDALRVEAMLNGWSELFADKYPHAGGPAHTALFIQNAQGFEIEIATP